MLSDVTSKSNEDLQRKAGDSWVVEEIVINLPLKRQKTERRGLVNC